MRTALCLLLVMLSINLASADKRTSALDYEAKLDKEVTLRLRAAALKEVLAEIDKVTGVHLLVDREVAADKATVCVKDQPAREVLRALAHCFNLGWSASPRGADRPYLRLWMDRDYVDAMSAREFQDYLSIVGQYDKELKATAPYLASEEPYTPPADLMAKYNRENEPEYHRLERRELASKNPDLGAAVLQFLALSEKQCRQLFSGELVSISGVEICEAAIKRWPEAKSFAFTTDRTVSGYMLRCAIRPGKVGGTKLLSSAYFEDSAYAKDAELASKRLLLDPEFNKPLPQGRKYASEADIAPGTGSATVPATMSDGLIELAELAGIPIVAQHATQYKSANLDWVKLKAQLLRSGASNAGERAVELAKQHMYTVGRDGQILLGKCLLWHRLRLREVPEASIRAWQKECSGLPYPTFDGFVAMAPHRWEQVRGTLENYRHFFGARTLIHLARAEYPLKIYAGLTEDQRKWLQAGKPLPASTLTPEQQVLFMCGFEVRERPTYEGVTDRDWQSTASISLEQAGYAERVLFARAGLRPLGELAVDATAIVLPENTPREEAKKLIDKQVTALLPATAKKLREQVAKEHPDVPAKDVRIYCVRYYVWTLKLGETLRQSEMACSVPVE